LSVRERRKVCPVKAWKVIQNLLGIWNMINSWDLDSKPIGSKIRRLKIGIEWLLKRRGGFMAFFLLGNTDQTGGLQK